MFAGKGGGVLSVQGVSNSMAQLIEALRYQPEGHGFDFRWCHWNFSSTYPFGRTMALELTQPLNRNQY